MRDIGIDCPFGVPDADFEDQSSILSNCERWLLDIELNLDDSQCTFSAVQWALGQLERFELQEKNPDFGGGLIDQGGAEQTSSRTSAVRAAGGKVVENLTCTLESPARIDLESRSSAPAIENTIASSARQTSEQILIRTEDGNDGSLPGNKIGAEEATRVGAKDWRQIFNTSRSGKRKPEESASFSEGEKKAKVGGMQASNKPEDLVIAADLGEAGKRMAECINSRLAVPECLQLTNLVSHCLLVSMDQVPEESMQEAVLGSRSKDAEDSRNAILKPSVFENESGRAISESSDEWMWLHNWLVRTILSDSGDDGRFASLHWLVAFITSTRQSLFKPILDELASDLMSRETQCSPTLPSYLRRSGVLEYAAYRGPERIFGSLHPFFPKQIFPSSQKIVEELGGGARLWQGWLGLMILCPNLFAAFCCTWVPSLSAELVLSWELDARITDLPAIWTTIEETCFEEPKTIREWLHMAILRRLPELAPVATSLVVLLAGCEKALCDNGSSDARLGFGNSLLIAIYKELSKHVVPKTLGSRPDSTGEAHLRPEIHRMGGERGVLLFMENLKQHSHVLWRTALDRYCASKCPCCDVSPNPENQLDSSRKYKTPNDDSTVGVELSSDGRAEGFQSGCMYRDPLIQMFHLALLCCTEHTVAELLVSASLLKPFSVGLFEAKSLRKLLMVMRTMRIASSQGRGTSILELWAQQMTDQATVASDEQAFYLVLAMRQLLDPTFWQKYQVLGSSSQFASADGVLTSENSAEISGMSWKLVWTGLRKVLDVRWLSIWYLMLRDGAWDLKIAVLGVLELLNTDVPTARPQVDADRLKVVVGLFFYWLEMSDDHDYRSGRGRCGSKTLTFDRKWRWQFSRAMEHLKSIIIELASSTFSSFTLMVNSFLDFSFEHSIQIPSESSQFSSTSPFPKRELSGIPFQRSGSGTRSSFSMAPLSAGRLDRYGKLVLASGPMNSTGSSRSTQMLLTEENCRIQSGAVTSLQLYEKEKVTAFFHSNNSINQDSTSAPNNPDLFKKEIIRRTKVLEAELGSLLRRTLSRATTKSAENPSAWPCHPAGVLATQMADRMETPHEISMKMEQYEEILPKQTSSLRHIFLADCFSQNPLLMEMVELVVKYGRKRDIQRCVEFIRVLLAESISHWHSAFRTRDTSVLRQAKIDDEELWNRIKVNRLIELVATANWLPQPLASSGEIVAVIDGADISDLLLLVWRCMHHAMAFGTKSWTGTSSTLSATVASSGPQAVSADVGAGEEGKKEESYTEWEGHYFAILRRNVSLIGAHLAHLYPIRKAF